MVEKPEMDDPLTVLLADAPKQSLVNLLVQLDSARKGRLTVNG